jgi:hypothetical protein
MINQIGRLHSQSRGAQAISQKAGSSLPQYHWTNPGFRAMLIAVQQGAHNEGTSPMSARPIRSKSAPGQIGSLAWHPRPAYCDLPHSHVPIPLTPSFMPQNPHHSPKSRIIHINKISPESGWNGQLGRPRRQIADRFPRLLLPPQVGNPRKTVQPFAAVQHNCPKLPRTPTPSRPVSKNSPYTFPPPADRIWQKPAQKPYSETFGLNLRSRSFHIPSTTSFLPASFTQIQLVPT